MDPVKPSLLIKNLGRRDYQSVWSAMQQFTDHRDINTTDELWLVEHPPVFTQGLAGKAEHLLAPGDIPVVQVDRGGQVTYHGPGQIVAYPLIDLRRHGIGVKSLVHGIEQAVIDVLAQYDVAAERKLKAPGVYVKGDKIAALGLKIRKGCSYHGLAFNIDMDLSPFARINPCGFSGLKVIQLRDLNQECDVPSVQKQLVNSFCKNLNFSSHQAPLAV
ncbi:MAG: lipoyl(octanoyl) transferase LipB [Proteobacteria bacterium]|nr:MAG: lipoyl(octanoyl) transferase LipB [Pseudomonadota bacterium]